MNLLRIRSLWAAMLFPASLLGVVVVADDQKEAVQANEAAEEQLIASLPESFQEKVKTYLEQDAKIETEIRRMEAMAQAGGNAWAQRRATGMAARLNNDLRKHRLLRQELFREYRSLLLSGWKPEGGDMDQLERLLFGESTGS